MKSLASPYRISPFVGLSFLLFPLLLVSAEWARGADEKQAATVQAEFEQKIRPLLAQYCLGCHGDKNPSAGVNLAGYKDVASLQKDQATWRKVLARMQERTMPPARMPHPTAEQQELLTVWFAHTLNNTDEKLLPRNPGRVLIHRLNRLEYNNTMRDLLGIISRPADKFPADGGGGGGFDNNADTLFIPPILMERYLVAASEVLDEARPERLFTVRPSAALPAPAAARKIIAQFATRAYRRPVTLQETERLSGLYAAAVKRGASFEKAVKYALKGVLVSPNFLFRVEATNGDGAEHALSDYEIASRLSYFLWASLPDDELFRLAAQKRLHDPVVLDKQVTRMLRDPKARAFAESFSAQWLRAQELYSSAQPDTQRYTTFTPALRDAMYSETVEFFYSVVREDASLLRLLDADYTYLNEDLANHYGIPGVSGKEMRRVSLADGRRGGVLTQASILTVTSYPIRTSPVLRGKWVLEEILGTPAPPPPMNVKTLSQEDAPKAGLTFRQRLEEHRKNPTCASCHNRMDPLGFGLENYDAIGRWRNEIGGTPIDSSGVLANGEKFTGPTELKKHLLTRREAFVRNLTEKMLAYALGRGLEPYDQISVRKIVAAVEKENCRSGVLLREIVRSYPFQYRKEQ